ncbi:restriction endonuclease subunit S [Lacinutrix himadriensis]|uniref:restriction endonuclease subunit S n=1 Tax=Lacinutrix himadriensis TaxID=641549 RepID=UPI0006E17280|nr:restriction endonuclease subunit S [Lacinutrix himadriensis]
MSKLDVLLEGVEVEWKPLESVCSVLKGKQLNKTELTELGEYPAYNGGTNYSGFTNKFNVDKNTTIISQGGASAGFVQFIKRKFWANAHCYYLKPDIDVVENKYVYYFVKNKQSNLMNFQFGAGIPALKSDVIKKLEILIPCPDNPEKSLKIQKEIVRILDIFTEFSKELNKELTKELTVRRKQYYYYREQLLTFDESEVKTEILGSLAENLDSMRKPIASSLREPGNIPYYGASGIVDYVKDYIYDGDFLLISEDGANLIARKTPIAFSISGKNWVNNHAHVLKFNSYAERRFVEYYLNSIDLTPYISGAAQPKLNQRNLSGIKIPNPPLLLKEKIVSILDKFDTLTTSISEGLPKEIDLRKKQYEYYREKLLTFPNDNIEA